MALPAGINTITVTGDFADPQGDPVQGTVIFTPTNPLTDINGQLILTAAPIVVPLVSGAFSVVLPCTDSPALAPVPFQYAVTFAIPYTTQSPFTIVLPTSLGPTVDISSLAPIPAPATPAAGIYVSSVNGQSGVVTVDQLDGVTVTGTPSTGEVLTATSPTTAGWAVPGVGTAAGGDLAGNYPNPTVVATHLAAPLPVAQGGTGAGTAPAALANLGGFPVTQAVTTVSNSFADLFTVTSTGSTDPLGPFELATGGRTVNSILNQVYYLGYNALQQASSGNGANGSATINWWTDAGDTNSSGAHGVETNISWFGPAGNTATAAFQLVAVNDDTNTVTTSIRCGSGSSGSNSSNILFTNGNASITFCQMSNTAGNVVFKVPTSFTLAGANNNILFQSTGTNVATILTLYGTQGSGNVTNEIFFALSGVNQWAIVHAGPNFTITDVANTRTAIGFVPGTTSTGYVYTNSMHKIFGNLVIGSAALATNATSGFLYLPTMAGAPTGVPGTQTGTAAAAYDTTDNKLYVYNGGWKSVALT